MEITLQNLRDCEIGSQFEIEIGLKDYIPWLTFTVVE